MYCLYCSSQALFFQIFTVLAPAKIGTIASAYHHKAHLIHRGTVLCHDYETEAYLIQFEKKSLGYEWCADFEVASHGLPEKIFPSANDLPKQYCSQLQPNLYGTLTTGTDYGPLLGTYSMNCFTKMKNSDADIFIF